MLDRRRIINPIPEESLMDPASERALSSLAYAALAPAAIFALFYSVSALLIHPFGNYPFHDDWTYAWSVEQLLKSGDLRFLDWSIHYPITQILWGTLFCL